MPSPHIQHHSASLESLCLPQGENSPKSKAGRGGGGDRNISFPFFPPHTRRYKEPTNDL